MPYLSSDKAFDCSINKKRGLLSAPANITDCSDNVKSAAHFLHRYAFRSAAKCHTDWCRVWMMGWRTKDGCRAFAFFAGLFLTVRNIVRSFAVKFYTLIIYMFALKELFILE